MVKWYLLIACDSEPHPTLSLTILQSSSALEGIVVLWAMNCLRTQRINISYLWSNGDWLVPNKKKEILVKKRQGASKGKGKKWNLKVTECGTYKFDWLYQTSGYGLEARLIHGDRRLLDARIRWNCCSPLIPQTAHHLGLSNYMSATIL